MLSVKRLGKNTRTTSVEGALIVTSIDIPYLVCILSASITEYGFSFSNELMFTDLLEEASANLSHRFICQNAAHVNIPSHYKERGETVITSYSFQYVSEFQQITASCLMLDQASKGLL
jgi:hypothetical protein